MDHQLRDASATQFHSVTTTLGKESRTAPAPKRISPVAAPVSLERNRRSIRLDPRQWLGSHSFAPDWLPGQLRQPATGYLFAALIGVVAVLLTYLLATVYPWFAGCHALIFLGVVIVALSWGAGPSLVAAGFGVVLFEYVVTDPPFAWRPMGIDDIVILALLIGVSMTISLMTGAVERSRRHAVAERAEAQVRECASLQMQERMDEFLATASHDLRSPLTAAIGFNDLAAHRYKRLASAVLDTRPDLADQLGHVEASLNEAIQSGDQLSRLVTLLFDTARVRAGKLELHRVPCDLTAVVRDHIAALRMANPLRDLRLEISVEEPIMVEADADRIGQVITNYVTNAIKFSREDQPVAVWVAIAGGSAVVSVEDHGPGLPASEQQRIWQRFYQAEDVLARHKSGAGLGLGLHICKAIVEGHGGTVSLESAVGKGSTFWFTLPLTTSTVGSSE